MRSRRMEQLSLLTGATPAGGSAAGPVDERLSPDGRELFVNESAAGMIGEFAVSGGNLTPLGTTAVPTGKGSAGLVTN